MDYPETNDRLTIHAYLRQLMAMSTEGGQIIDRQRAGEMVAIVMAHILSQLEKVGVVSFYYRLEGEDIGTDLIEKTGGTNSIIPDGINVTPDVTSVSHSSTAAIGNITIERNFHRANKNGQCFLIITDGPKDPESEKIFAIGFLESDDQPFCFGKVSRQYGKLKRFFRYSFSTFKVTVNPVWLADENTPSSGLIIAKGLKITKYTDDGESYSELQFKP